MQIRNCGASAIALLVLSACASSYSVPNGKPKASLIAMVDNDSSDTNMQTFWAMATKTGKCDETTRLVSTLSAGASYASEPVDIEAGERIFVSSRYGEARFGQSRACASMLGFVPQPDHRYQVELQVRSEVNDCSIDVYDVTSGYKQKIAFELPPHACMDYKTTANGRPLWTDVHVHVILKKSK